MYCNLRSGGGGGGVMHVYVGAPGPPHLFCAVFQVREKMKRYWESNSKYASVEEMMLDSNAAQLTSHDKTDILGMLPKLEVCEVVNILTLCVCVRVSSVSRT